MEGKLVEDLQLERAPKGQITRLRVAMLHDALHQVVAVPVMVARGSKPGPVVGVTAAVHGDELNGIPVIHKLFQKLDLRSLKGTVVAVMVVNVPAFLLQQRVFNEGTDLNHIMPGEDRDNAVHLYARHFMERIVDRFDYLIDLHTASRGRVNCLYIRADLDDPKAAMMAHLHRPQIILHNPPSDGTLRGATMEIGIPAITVEIGDPQRFQPRYITGALRGLRAVLVKLGMVPRRKMKLHDAPVICSSSHWLRTDTGGLLEVFPQVTDLVQEGELIATQRNIYGDVIREYHCPHDGVVIGKSVNPVGQSGSRIVHLGALAAEGEFSFAGLDESSSAFEEGTA